MYHTSHNAFRQSREMVKEGDKNECLRQRVCMIKGKQWSSLEEPMGPAAHGGCSGVGSFDGAGWRQG